MKIGRSGKYRPWGDHAIGNIASKLREADLFGFNRIETGEFEACVSKKALASAPSEFSMREHQALGSGISRFMVIEVFSEGVLQKQRRNYGKSPHEDARQHQALNQIKSKPMA